MGQNYSKKSDAKSGNEYVQATEYFDAYVMHCMMQIPERWNEYLVAPIMNDSKEALHNVINANCCYVRYDKKSSLEDVIAAYDSRIKYLEEALRYFRCFNFDFDRLMAQTDLCAKENKRLTKALHKILQDENVISDDAAADSIPKNVSITLHYHIDSIEFKSVNGHSSMKLRLDEKKKDNILKYESKATKLIAERLTVDRQQRNAFRKRLTATGVSVL